MTPIRRQRVGTFSGSGVITNTSTGESLAVSYDFSVTQNILVLRDGIVPKEVKAKGSVSPAPEWELAQELILQLQDKTRMTFWLKSHDGEISGSGTIVSD